MEALGALIPSIGVALLFWFVVRAMIQADRRERAALAELDRQEQPAPSQDVPRGPAPPSSASSAHGDHSSR